MKVYVNASFLNITPMTGLSRFALTMSFGLKERFGSEVIFVVPNGPTAYPDLARELGVIQIGYNKKRTRWEQFDLPFYLWRKGSPLLINFGNSAPLYYRNQLVSILDIFYHRFDKVLQENHDAYPKIEVQFYRFVIPRILKAAKVVLTISEYSKYDIVDCFKLNPDKIKVVYPAIPDSFAKVDNPEPPNKYGKYILGVSSVNPRKNFEGLIRAYKQANFSDVKLIIVGDVHEERERYSLLREFKDDESIVFTGYITDAELKGLYANALFFAYPSFFEGFGIPPLEAMACGCPTLVSNVTSLPEVCGDASLYVDPYNVDSIARGMQQLYRDEALRQQLVREGYRRLAFFGKEKSIDKLVSIVNGMQRV